MKLNDTLRKLNAPVRAEIDFAYKSAKAKYKNIRFPCYGGRFYWFLVSRRFEYMHFYLTENSILYTASGISFFEIPFDNIRKISVRQSALAKSTLHVRVIADKRYHLFVYCNEHFSTELTGNEIDNANSFIDALKAGVDNIS